MTLHPLYILASILVGVAGSRRRAGFVGFTVIALLVTPLVAALLLYVAGTPPPTRDPNE